MKFEWEQIYLKADPEKIKVSTWRAKVPDGWIICNNTSMGNNIAQGVIFYPDPNHEWEVEE